MKEIVHGEITNYRGELVLGPKKIIICTNQDPFNIQMFKDKGLAARCTFIPFNKTIENPSYKLVEDVCENHLLDFTDYIYNMVQESAKKKLKLISLITNLNDEMIDVLEFVITDDQAREQVKELYYMYKNRMTDE